MSMPYAHEAEVAVLGGVLADSNAMNRVVHLGERDFYAEKNRRVWAAMLCLYGRSVVIDPVTLREELNTSGELEQIGGLEYIAELMDAVPTAANIEHHAGILREHTVRRQLAVAGGNITRWATDTTDGREALDKAEAALYAIAADRPDGTKTAKQAMKPFVERLEIVQDGGMSGIPTGWKELDELTGGWQKGELILVAARPSMGKTAFMVGTGLHAALAHKTPVLFQSMEMSEVAIMQRMAAHESFVDLSKIIRGGLTDHDYVQINQGIAAINSDDLLIDDADTMSILESRAKARRAVSQRRVGLILVDYIQLMSAGGENRTQEVSAISRGLKAIAKELDVPVIALSQLTRAPEQRADHRPRLSDLRESGSLEQDADLVIFLHRPEYYVSANEAHEKGWTGKAEAIIAKHRNGPTDTVTMHFRKECVRFESMNGRY